VNRMPDADSRFSGGKPSPTAELEELAGDDLAAAQF
jgi:hypothetical protein